MADQKKRGLGRGLESLIPILASTDDSIAEVPLASIKPNPRQPRTHFDAAELEELAASIREHGVLQPVVLTRALDGEGYYLIAGHRRWQAAKLAGRTKIAAVVRTAPDDRGLLELALIENVQRSNLNALETAAAYQTLADDFGLSHEEIAKRVGKRRTTVSNTLRLMRLAAPLQAALTRGIISEGHARALLGLPEADAQSAALATIVKRELSVRQTEELVRKLQGEKQPAKRRTKQSPSVAELENRVRDKLGTKVALRRGRKGKGSLIIYFYSDEELEALIKHLRA
ncbi:MAG: ParB/RepB/Spo0J family partition protein [Chloroflexi bacterium]|nr:MAG: ParB/RepB/Spo0J family partition protein [Chloroflexota bacterium]RLT47097.1 MAG: ParB/RepB/Spo0J family partition protein [Chloroflexota bacterium]RLT53399.1 MAG: ParB/RepB/Spo0J family partition protein [Chloroflexota bacterium]